jgi:hypothetical protein
MNISRIFTLGGAVTALLTSSFVLQAAGQTQGATGQASGAATDVVVVNGPVEAVPTKNQNDGPYQPFSASGNLLLPGGTVTASFTVPVPAGKRLVIEQVSMYFQGQKVSAILTVKATSAGLPTDTFVKTPPALYDGGNYKITGTQPVRIFVDGGTTFTIFAYKTSDQWNTYNAVLQGGVTVTGYLVDLP